MGAEAAMNAVGLPDRESRTTPGRLHPPRWLGSLSGVFALLGVIGLLLMTRWGIGTSPDSVGYLQAARSIVATSGGVLVRPEGPGAVALTHFAPLYSFLLSFGGLIGLDPLDWARWLNAALFAANVLVVSVLLRDALGGAIWLRMAGTLWMLASAPMLAVHVSMLSEAAFLFLTFLGFWAVAKYLDGATRRLLVLAALSLGAAWLTRYAGVVSILAGGVALLWFGTRPVAQRFRDAVLLGVLGSAGMLAWMARNALLSHSATGRELAFHPIERGHLWQALYTASSWLMIPQTAPDRIRFATFGVLGIAGIAVLLGRGRAHEPPGAAKASESVVPAVVKVLALFAASYMAFLAFSISFFDANTPLDDRILSPVYIAGIVLSLWIARQGLRIVREWKPVLATALAVGLAAFTGALVIQGARMVAASHERGWGFSAPSWRASPTLERLRTLPEGVAIYSNVPELIYLHSGRLASPIPRPWSPMNRKANPEYGPQMAALERTLAEDPSVVVYFTSLTRGPRAGNERELMAELSLRVRDQLADGLLLCAAACP